MISSAVEDVGAHVGVGPLIGPDSLPTHSRVTAGRQLVSEFSRGVT
jgi:hypothetical protein